MAAQRASLFSPVLGLMVGLGVVAAMWGLDLVVRDLPATPGSLLLLHQVNPLHWIVDLAPLQLAFMGWLLDRKVAAHTPQAPPQAPTPSAPPSLGLADPIYQRLIAERDEAHRLTRAKSAFFAGMSHELRTPLNAILGYSELLEEELEEEGLDMSKDLGRIAASGRYLLGLINDILDLSKLDAGRMSVVLEPVPVGPLIEDVIATLEPLAAKNDNVLVPHVEPDLAARGDAMRLKQILINLVSNASKFTKGGKIDLIAERVDGEVALRVRDTGIGMTPEQLDRLFADYAQADSKIKREYGGTGLGLVLSKRFAEMMGGRIEVESEAGDGSTFSLFVDAVAFTPRLAPTESLTVLVVDDDPAPVRELNRRALSAAGMRPCFAGDTETARKLWRSEEPDAVVIDVSIEDERGWLLLMELAKAGIPVIVATADDDPERAAHAGARGSLPTPVDRALLINLLKQIAGESSGT